MRKRIVFVPIGLPDEAGASRTRTFFLVLGAVVLLLSLVVTGIGHARGEARRSLQTKPALTDEAREKLLAAGKKIFVERCAKCHNERGDKALRTGKPLSQRELSEEELAQAVSGRLKDAPDEEKRAVVLYVRSFMKREQ